MHKSDSGGNWSGWNWSGGNCARVGIVSIPKKSKNKQMFTDRVRNDRVR